MTNSRASLSIAIALGVFIVGSSGLTHYLSFRAGRLQTHNEIAQVESDLWATEEARQALNHELWEERQKIKQLEEETVTLQEQVDTVTVDRERLREEHTETRTATVALIQGLKSLDASQYLTLCEQWALGGVKVESAVEVPELSQEQRSYFTILLNEACSDANY